MGTRIEYATYVYISNILINEIKKGIDVCKEYGLTKGNLSNIICNFD